MKKTGITGIANATDIRIIAIGARIDRRTAFQTDLTGLFQLVGKVDNRDIVFYTTGEASIDNMSNTDMFADAFSGTFSAYLSMSNDSDPDTPMTDFPNNFELTEHTSGETTITGSSVRNSIYNVFSSFRLKG